MARTLRRHSVMPLDEFPAEHRARIQEAVDQPVPPPPHTYFGFPGDLRPLAQTENRAWWEWHWQRGIDPDARRTRLPAHLRQAVLARDGLTCGLCGKPVEADDVHIDHIKPVALGGTDKLSNLQVAHSLCNLKKGARV